MAEENVIDTKQQSKNPIEQAVNKLREAKIKEVQGKVDAATKVAFDAKIVYDNSMDKLKSACEELEFEKSRLNEFAKTAK